MNNNNAQPAEFKSTELSAYENHLVKQKLLEITDKLRQQRIGQQQPKSPSPTQLDQALEQQQLMHPHPYMTFQVHPHSQVSLKNDHHYDHHDQSLRPSPIAGVIGQKPVAHLQQQQQQQQQQRMMYQMPLSMQQKQMQSSQQQAYRSFSPTPTSPVNNGQNSFSQRPNTQQQQQQQLVYKLSSQSQPQRQQQAQTVQQQQQCIYQLSPSPTPPTPQYQLFANDNQPSFTWSSQQQQQQEQKSQQSSWSQHSSSNQIQSKQQQKQAQHFQSNAPQMIGYVIQTPVQQQASPQQQKQQHFLTNSGINGQHQLHIAQQQQQMAQHQNVCQSQVVGVTPIITTQAHTPIIAAPVAMQQQNQLLTCLPLTEDQMRTLAKLQHDAYARINSNNNGGQQVQQHSPVQSPIGSTPKKQTTTRSFNLADEEEKGNEMYDKFEDACRDYIRMRELGNQNQTMDQITTIIEVAKSITAAGSQSQVRHDEKISESNEVSDEEGTKSSISTSNDSGASTGDAENDFFEKSTAVFEEEEEVIPEVFPVRKSATRPIGHDFLMSAYIAQERNRHALENGFDGQSDNCYELFPRIPEFLRTRPPPGFTLPK